MADLHPADFRNIAFAGHASTGKTSLAEALLHTAKATTRSGKVDDGTSILDFEDEEKERKHSIDSAIAHATWKGKTVQMIDTPGYPDFVGSMIGSLRAVETVVLVVSDAAGCREAEGEVAGVETVVTKRGTGWNAAELVPEDEVVARIREAIPSALARAGGIAPLVPELPAELRVTYQRVPDAERIAARHGLERADGWTTVQEVASLRDARF